MKNLKFFFIPLSFLMTLFLVSTLIIGCGQTSGSEEEEGESEVMAPGDNTLMDKLRATPGAYNPQDPARRQPGATSFTQAGINQSTPATPTSPSSTINNASSFPKTGNNNLAGAAIEASRLPAGGVDYTGDVSCMSCFIQ